MGIFRKKHTLPRSEAAMVAAADLGPVTLRLDNYSLTFEDCQWTPDYDVPDLPENASCLEQELIQLRRDKRKMRKDMEKFMWQAQEMKDLKERWNLLDFKYQLLLDMWTMRALDNKKEESYGNCAQKRRSNSAGMSPTSGKSHDHSPNKPRNNNGHYNESPSRHSPIRRNGHHSPPGNGCYNDTPPKLSRNRHLNKNHESAF